MDSTVDKVDLLLRAIDEREAVVGVIGLGYVGIPLVLASCAAGFNVIGFDIDPDKIDRLNRGESFIKHIPSADIRGHVENRRFRATGDFSELASADVIL